MTHSQIARTVTRDLDLRPALTGRIVFLLLDQDDYSIGAADLRRIYGDDYAAMIESRILQEADQ